jgi:Flp pilus assembly pilin Flp
MRDDIDEKSKGLQDRLADEEGQTLPEYALLVVFIAMVAMAAVQTLGGNLLAYFTTAALAL